MSKIYELIKSNQQALADLNLYVGKIDGVWNLKSRLAMAGLQHSPAFVGLKARPDSAYFAPFEPLPIGWSWSDEGAILTSPVQKSSQQIYEEKSAAEVKRNELIAAETKKQEEAKAAAKAQAEADALAATAAAEQEKAKAEQEEAELLAMMEKEESVATAKEVELAEEA